jgi:hypothetical protein
MHKPKRRLHIPSSQLNNLSKEQPNGPPERLISSDPFGGAASDRRGRTDMYACTAAPASPFFAFQVD